MGQNGQSYQGNKSGNHKNAGSQKNVSPANPNWNKKQQSDLSPKDTAQKNNAQSDLMAPSKKKK